MNESARDVTAKLRLTLDLSYFPSKISEYDLTGAIQTAISNSLANVMGLDIKKPQGEPSIAVAAVSAPPTTTAEAWSRYGWPDHIYTHAVAVGTDVHENDKEGVLTLNNDVEIRVPAFGACDYVRVTQGGFELMYWTADEWRDEPTEVMGAIMGLVINQQERPTPPRVAEPNYSLATMGRN